ncbi:EamA family transporter RarD [Galbitalea sp. SE-J8]|uniref:EamA family transporter RarD n=1 Tax=Galbitalea sp. SE-J8 TaxID=3054952 RepID=UPI00259D1DC5|nr:EamA family transporter RarD [Galbitalea sp. SE-J8]MDM4761441.1 EamA family transporter RarD [Galbitalea sp. SE-J8]
MTPRSAGAADPRPLGERTAAGLGYAVGAYGWWGLMPLYFLLLVPASALEIVAWRMLLSVAVCAILLTVTGGWRTILALVRTPRATLLLGLASLFIVVNWLVYVYASVSGHVVEAALGYFINPIVTVLLGVVVLGDRLRPLQWAAIGVSLLAIAVLVVGYGRFPWISIVLAVSFGGYGLIKKRVGASVDALSGLTLETAWLAAPASVVLIVLAGTGGLVTGTVGAGHTVATMFAGVITSVPLLLFAAATRRLSLSAVGLTQYLTPVIQFVFGVVVMHEDMPAARWIGFAIVWVALALLTVDMLGATRFRRRPQPLDTV